MYYNIGSQRKHKFLRNIHIIFLSRFSNDDRFTSINYLYLNSSSSPANRPSRIEFIFSGKSTSGVTEVRTQFQELVFVL